MAERALIRQPVCFEVADARPIFIVFVRQPAGWLRVPYAGKPRWRNAAA